MGEFRKRREKNYLYIGSRSDIQHCKMDGEKNGSGN